MDLKPQIDQYNRRLKAAQISVTIEQAGKKLKLRATLPPKPNSPKQQAHQQRISLGLPANPEGLRQAYAEAKMLGGLLASRQFSWDKYIAPAVDDTAKTCSDWLEQFHNHYITAGGSEDTWEGDYLKILKRLPASALLPADLLEAVPHLWRCGLRWRQHLSPMAQLAQIQPLQQ